MSLFIAAVLGYLLGCIQTAYLVGQKVKSIDIRQHGTQNAGASNVTTLMGWRYGALVAMVDILKATLAVSLGRALAPQDVTPAFVAGAAAIVGHIFPVFLRFRGGKGAASLIGMLIGLDLRLALVAAALLVSLTLVTDYIALGSIAMYLMLPIGLYILHYSPLCIAISIGLAVLIIWKHWINITRIRTGTEVGLRSVMLKNKRT